MKIYKLVRIDNELYAYVNPEVDYDVAPIVIPLTSAAWIKLKCHMTEKENTEEYGSYLPTESAVNGAYGVGIDPNAVTELLAALIDLHKRAKIYGMFADTDDLNGKALARAKAAIASAFNCSGDKGYLPYNTSTQEYTNLHSVNIEKGCNGVTVINKGTTLALWNGLPLNPGESMSVGGNEGEVFIGRVDISFVIPVPAPAVITNSAWVIQKFYVGKNYIG